MLATSWNARSNARQVALLKEAYRLTQRIAAEDKKIERALHRNNGRLARFLEELEKDSAEAASEKTRDGIKEVLAYTLEAIGLSVRLSEASAFVVAGIFQTQDMMSARDAYFDAHPRELQKYEAEKQRLRWIYAELYQPGPPRRIDLNQTRCAVEACWRAR